METIHKAWEWATEPGPDPRIEGWPLQSPDWIAPSLITLAYIVFIPIGKAYMAKREPLKIKGLVIAHNLFLMALSLYMTVETLLAAYEAFGWGEKFTPLCNPVDGHVVGKDAYARGEFSTPAAKRLARIVYIHYLSKAYEFVDTYIMIGKKNFKQISFLHVYHHATTFFPVWALNVHYGPGGETYYCCALNSFVHVIMYGYYALAGLGFKVKAKKFVTQLQMVQFLTYIFQGSYDLITDCYKPRIQCVFVTVQCTIFFILFLHFYIMSYTKGRTKKTNGLVNGSKKD